MNKKGNIEILDKDLDDFWARIRDFVVLGVKHNYKTTVYQGTHPKFGALKEGDLIPDYCMELNSTNKKYKLLKVKMPARRT